MVTFLGLGTATSDKQQNKALDGESPIASFVKPILIGGGPVNAVVLQHIEE